MKIVQDALKNISVPVFPDTWRPMGDMQNPPAQYCVYTTSTVPDDDWDDGMRSTRMYVYLNLWSENDPTDMAKVIREAMMAARFGMIEEETGSSSSTRYDESTHRHAVFWTWVLHVDENGEAV